MEYEGDLWGFADWCGVFQVGRETSLRNIASSEIIYGLNMT
jgi:hypothetical protein